MQIICDSNIWYGLVSHSIPSNIVHKGKLILTPVILREIASSINWATNNALAREVCIMIKRYCGRVIHVNPFNWMLEHYQDDSQSVYLYKELGKLAYSQHHFPNPSDDQLKEMYKLAKAFEDDLRPAIDYQNSYFKEIKSQLPKGDKRTKWRNSQERKESIKKFLADLCAKGLKHEVSVSDINWDRIEFFFEVYTQFLYRCETGDLVMNQNDVEDFFNLVYVTKKAKYYTHDNRVNSTIFQAGMQRYVV